MTDDTIKKIVSTIIDKEDFFRQRRKQMLRNKLGKLASKDLPEALNQQAEIEEVVRQKLEEIDKGKEFRRFLNPTLHSDFIRETNPVWVLYSYAEEAVRENTINPKNKLALKIARASRNDLIRITNSAVAKASRLKKLAGKAPLPKYPLTKIQTAIAEYKRMITFFESLG